MTVKVGYDETLAMSPWATFMTSALLKSTLEKQKS